MTYNRNVVAQLHRLGEYADVFAAQDTATTNQFNNPDTDWSATPDRQVIAFRTYPNRNTEVNNHDGQLHRDRPVFVFPKDDDDAKDHNPVPGENDRLRYPAGNGTVYELQAPTEYETHVEMFGERVTGHPENGA